MRQLLAQGLLGVSDDGYGTLVITAGSGDVLTGARQVPMRQEPERIVRGRGTRTTRSRGGQVVDLPEEAQGLFEALRAWRSEQAKEQGVPAYVVFADVTLREVATVRPADLGQLAQVTGVGQKKLDTYGEGLLAVVAAETSASA
ncbi:HRDC domain-containing protein [Clavibacter michiganensis]|uniref:HRDC domain-containing protein n=1 Tax=Clavibacter michiganensis TaxID=28447 RepID=UPI0021575285|nr:HRDC domain-containing protein [Clavibacter michiganensis]